MTSDYINGWEHAMQEAIDLVRRKAQLYGPGKYGYHPNDQLVHDVVCELETDMEKIASPEGNQ